MHVDNGVQATSRRLQPNNAQTYALTWWFCPRRARTETQNLHRHFTRHTCLETTFAPDGMSLGQLTVRVYTIPQTFSRIYIHVLTQTHTKDTKTFIQFFITRSQGLQEQY